MRKHLLSTTAVTAVVAMLSGPVWAADLPRKAPPAPAPVVAPLSWTGWYIGGHIGWGKSNWSGTWDPSESPAVAFSSFNKSGIVGGIQGGYNWQFAPNPWGSFVLGIEGDISATGGLSKSAVDGGFTCHPPNFSAQCGSRIDALASIRGRLGLAFDRILVYGTGGWGWAKGKFYAGSSRLADQTQINFNTNGVVYGGGVEWMALPHLVVGVEYLRYNFNRDINFVTGGSEAGRPGTVSLDHIDVVRLRANYKF